MSSTTTLRVRGALCFWGIVISFFGLVSLATAIILCLAWFDATYTPREFVPFRTTLTQIEPGYTFAPGYPSVDVPMQQFRKEAAGKAFILSYPLRLENVIARTTNSWIVGRVYYLMQKSGPAGIVYLVSSEEIPDYNHTGSIGYNEHTAWDSSRLAFVSVKEGTSYWVLMPTGVFFLIGIVFFAFGLGLLSDSKVLIIVDEKIKKIW